MRNSGVPTFAGLDQSAAGDRAGSFISGFVLQAALVAGLLLYVTLAPRVMPTEYGHIDLVAPSPDLAPPRTTATKPEPVKPAPIVQQVQPVARPEVPVLEVRRPERVRPLPQPEVAQPVAIPAPRFDAKVLNQIPAPKAPKVVTTANFGSSATPTLDHVAVSKVQTGGFGDPNGVPVNAKGSGKANIGFVGSFDMPRGAGYGNGSGGANGARGTVASAGFGNGIATQGGPRGTAQNRVQTTSFNTVAAPAQTRREATPRTGASVPVSIQSKPNPVYTAEARKHNVEGEVLINVVFTADGKVKILNVVRGLGYGLDEAAARAVKGLKFSPATKDGRPVDSNATLHVMFQLS